MITAVINNDDEVIGIVNDPPAGCDTISVAGVLTIDKTPVNVIEFKISNKKKYWREARHAPMLKRVETTYGDHWMFEEDVPGDSEYESEYDDLEEIMERLQNKIRGYE